MTLFGGPLLAKQYNAGFWHFHVGLLFETRGFVHVYVPYMEVGSNKVVENDPDAHERPLDTSVQTTVTTFSLLQNY